MHIKMKKVIINVKNKNQANSLSAKNNIISKTNFKK